MTLLLLLLMLATAGWAVDDSRWVGQGANGRSATEFVPWALVLGGIWGFATAKSRMPSVLAHLLGAGIGVAYVIVSVAGVLSAADALPVRIRALTDSVDRFYFDVVWEHIRSSETSAFLLAIGGLAWGSGMYAAFAVFRRQRVMSAVFVPGVVLLANMSITVKPQYPFLVIFAAAALLLVVRMNLLEQRVAWARRKIGDAGYVSGLYMRSGLVFVSVALVGSLALTATASSAPLAGAWEDADDELVRIGSDINFFLGGVTGPARGPTGLFANSQTIRGFWESSPKPVFRATSSDGRGHYWRGATYDYFDGNTWQQLDRDSGIRIAPGDDLLEPSRDAIDANRGRSEVDLTVTALDGSSDVLLSPESPLVTDRTADLYTNLPGGPYATIRFAERLRAGDSYSVVAAVRNDREARGGLTENQLANAGVTYPAWAQRYIRIRQGSMGPATAELANSIVASLPASQRDPYHVAKAIQEYLYRGGGFRYQTDVRGLCPSGQTLMDCFLETKVGYCEYYATAMVMLLRTQKIPARFVLGYLPGRKLPNGSWEVDQGAAHAWAEVYFPGYGWVRFDATPGNFGNGQTPTRFEQGAAIEEPDPSGGPRPTFRDPRDAIEFEPEEPGEAVPTQDVSALPGAPSGQGPLGGVLIGLVAALALGAALLVMWTRVRRQRPAPAPDAVYRGVARIAGRFGYGPRPTQTAYEYAGTLSDLVPSVRTELQLVATAKVESTYAARPPEGDALAALRDAYRRLRVGLLRLAFRRRGGSPGGVRRPRSGGRSA